MIGRSAVLAVAALAAASLLFPSHAETAAEFYKGRRIELVVGSNAGTGYDDYARLLARHIGRHIPGEPQVIVRTWAAPAGARRSTTSIPS